MLLGDLPCGSWVLAYQGSAVRTLTEDEARQTNAALDALEAAAAEVIGFDVVEMLGYRDSGMADTEPNNHPDCFHQADIDEATGRLVAIVRRERPQVIITYGDDQRGYPHPDHLLPFICDGIAAMEAVVVTDLAARLAQATDPVHEVPLRTQEVAQSLSQDFVIFQQQQPHVFAPNSP